jgi:hypothetical protein
LVFADVESLSLAEDSTTAVASLCYELLFQQRLASSVDLEAPSQGSSLKEPAAWSRSKPWSARFSARDRAGTNS